MELFYKGQPTGEKIFRALSIILYTILWGWAVPVLVVLPIIRLTELWDMAVNNTPVLLGPDLSLLIPCTIAVCYLSQGEIMRHVLKRSAWLRPLLLQAWVAAVTLTLTAHACYLLAGDRTLVILAAVTGIIVWRITISVIFLKWPRLGVAV